MYISMSITRCDFLSVIGTPPISVSHINNNELEYIPKLCHQMSWIRHKGVGDVDVILGDLVA